MERCSVIAHRGANFFAPQNTIPAFEKALELGADGFETDVHMTKDNHLVLCHNYSIDGTSNGRGLIANTTLRDLKEFDFGAYFARKFRGTRLPSLEEFLSVAKSPKLKIMNIELKSPKSGDVDIVHRTIDAVKSFGLFDKLLISSFDRNLLTEAKKIDENCQTAYLYPSVISAAKQYFIPPLKLAKEIGVNAIHPQHGYVNKSIVEKAHSAGIKVNVWTVNAADTIKKMLSAGVDGLITDCPDDVNEIVDEYMLSLGSE